MVWRRTSKVSECNKIFERELIANCWKDRSGRKIYGDSMSGSAASGFNWLSARDQRGSARRKVTKRNAGRDRPTSIKTIKLRPNYRVVRHAQRLGGRPASHRWECGCPRESLRPPHSQALSNCTRAARQQGRRRGCTTGRPVQGVHQSPLVSGAVVFFYVAYPHRHKLGVDGPPQETRSFGSILGRNAGQSARADAARSRRCALRPGKALCCVRTLRARRRACQPTSAGIASCHSTPCYIRLFCDGFRQVARRLSERHQITDLSGAIEAGLSLAPIAGDKRENVRDEETWLFES